MKAPWICWHFRGVYFGNEFQHFHWNTTCSTLFWRFNCGYIFASFVLFSFDRESRVVMCVELSNSSPIWRNAIDHKTYPTQTRQSVCHEMQSQSVCWCWERVYFWLNANCIGNEVHSFVDFLPNGNNDPTELHVQKFFDFYIALKMPCIDRPNIVWTVKLARTVFRAVFLSHLAFSSIHTCIVY